MCYMKVYNFVRVFRFLQMSNIGLKKFQLFLAETSILILLKQFTEHLCFINEYTFNEHN